MRACVRSYCRRRCSIAVRAAFSLLLAGVPFSLEANQGFDPPVMVQMDRVDIRNNNINHYTNDHRLSAEFVKQRWLRQKAVIDEVGLDRHKQILFGDLHVHTTYSDDAFWFSLPLMQGSSGVRPPTSACNYARYISQLDFMAVTDHAESYTPQHWKNSVKSVRQCAEVGASGGEPDLVPFLGYEWTQIGKLAETHYGHHNVIFKGLGVTDLPPRPIAHTQNILTVKPDWADADAENRSYYWAFQRWLDVYRETPLCAVGVDTRSLPRDCFEFADTPAELLRKLDEFGAEALVIPHGMAWGFSSPLNLSWEKHLKGDNFRNDRVRMLEVYSGHGNSEVWRDIPSRVKDASGNWTCPEPTKEFLPTCWRAGEIIEQRCLQSGAKPAECRARAAETRQMVVNVNTRAGWLTVPGTEPSEWLDAGQLRDAFQPAHNYRPGKSAQAALATTVEENGQLRNLVWGFIASTDTHRGKAGHGFKQYRRTSNIDTSGVRDPKFESLVLGDKPEPASSPIDIPADDNAGLYSFGGIEAEKNSSFMYVGGLAAVHAEERSRDAIWEGLLRREVYGTSGPRILLWFDLINAKEGGLAGIAPMGSEVSMKSAPRFKVVAAGSFKQRGGCPPQILEAITAKGVNDLAEGECYFPSDERRKIQRIEVVKITPRKEPDETFAELIHDTFLVLPCVQEGPCVVEFEDPSYSRDTTYYVRAIEEPSLTINAKNLRAEFDKNGVPVSVDPCFDSYKTGKFDDCLAPAAHRAWSSPIYLRYGK